MRKALQGQTAWFEPEFILFCAARRNFTVTDSVFWLVNQCKYLLITIATKLYITHVFFFNPAIRIVTFVTFFGYIDDVAVCFQRFRETGAKFPGWAQTGRKGLRLEVQRSTHRAWLCCSAVENV